MKRLGVLVMIFSIAFIYTAKGQQLIEKEGKLYLNNSLYSGKQEIFNNAILSSVFTIKNGKRDGKVTHYYNNSKTKLNMSKKEWSN